MPPKDTKPAGDGCPSCGGEFIVDEKQRPETLIDRKVKNASIPAVAARFADHVRSKAAEHGLVHRCVSCGYQSRFHPAKRSAA